MLEDDATDQQPSAGEHAEEILTMHRAKGTEFSRVIITDVGFRSPADEARLAAMEPSERADAQLRRRSLEYVAATRARDELVVFRRS